jgi:hypothetical protein
VSAQKYIIIVIPNFIEWSNPVRRFNPTFLHTPQDERTDEWIQFSLEYQQQRPDVHDLVWRPCVFSSSTLLYYKARASDMPNKD